MNRIHQLHQLLTNEHDSSIELDGPAIDQIEAPDLDGLLSLQDGRNGVFVAEPNEHFCYFADDAAYAEQIAACLYDADLIAAYKDLNPWRELILLTTEPIILRSRHSSEIVMWFSGALVARRRPEPRIFLGGPSPHETMGIPS